MKRWTVGTVVWDGYKGPGMYTADSGPFLERYEVLTVLAGVLHRPLDAQAVALLEWLGFSPEEFQEVLDD